METLNAHPRALAKRLIRRLAKAIGVLGVLDRMDRLEHEIQETRRLHQRLAELTDVVTEVLVPAADRDDDRIREVLAKYHRTSF
jgi:hypothetical protein